MPKDAARVAAYGEVDELNAVLGLLTAHARTARTRAGPRDPERLFDVGADLVSCRRRRARGQQVPPGGAGAIRAVGEAIDRLNEGLEPLRSFILPGGAPAAAWLHLARARCAGGAERELVRLTHTREGEPARADLPEPT